MRKIIAGFAISIDAFMEGPSGEIDWIKHDPEHFKNYSQKWKEIDTMFYGRKTYEAVLKYTATQKSNPFAHMKHYVFSRTLKKTEGDFILLNGETTEEVNRIRNLPGKDIAVFGGAIFVSSLMNLGLIDELQYAISPVILGKGRPMFVDIEARNYFKLEECTHYPSGLVALTYRSTNSSS